MKATKSHVSQRLVLQLTLQAEEPAASEDTVSALAVEQREEADGG